MFNAPQLFLDTDPDWGLGVEHAAKVPQIATYTSYFEFAGKHYLWYPERKHFLLGKVLGRRCWMTRGCRADDSIQNRVPCTGRAPLTPRRATGARLQLG